MLVFNGEKAVFDAPNIGLYLIKWSLGKIKGKHDVTIRVNYWPEGKQEESSNQSQSDDSSNDPNKQSKEAKARSILSRSLKSPTKKKNVTLLSKTAWV